MQSRDPGEQIERQADELEEHLARLDDHLGDAKAGLEARREDAVGAGDAGRAAGDWEDSEGASPQGDDPSGFDDPEADEDEDEE